MAVEQSSFVILAGATAARKIREEGFRQEHFSTLVGASGGPKWLVISQLDRLLMDEFFKSRQAPIAALGSSIGSFRNMCYALENPRKALEQLEHGYIHQRYSSDKPTPEEITRVGDELVASILGQNGAEFLTRNPVWQNHFVTVRSRGLLASERPALLGPSLLVSALANVVSRKTLGAFWDRVVFHTGENAAFEFEHLDTTNVRLSPGAVKDSVIASGSIPLVMSGIQTPEGAPRGNYRDGGVTDYHFDLRFSHPEGLILYPHFFPYIVPGWFDKSLRGRWVSGSAMDRTVLVAPSPAFVAGLPNGKVPDRNDFRSMGEAERIACWNRVVAECERMAQEFYTAWQSGDLERRVVEVTGEQKPQDLAV
ncbi:hypothetical protein [Biformimicrobium ophioploci]|uniref:Patatin-like phospholipase family protein n=1 Tax=Biformimicrobium ophioploci TaxID=3036711 RepID=A0ABQ6M2F3_9GAMM|nr:hypothetical protein [Microbulbifer sp. NKW57]GMG88508.1 hypothetical protein MNKW57_28290 [Microbulbifer sp. NKW57]